tara:strand:- start:95 stop:1750 length:1656 start_codon:yes stop_codon:yes gene_type:complete
MHGPHSAALKRCIKAHPYRSKPDVKLPKVLSEWSPQEEDAVTQKLTGWRCIPTTGYQPATIDPSRLPRATCHFSNLYYDNGFLIHRVSGISAKWTLKLNQLSIGVNGLHQDVFKAEAFDLRVVTHPTKAEFEARVLGSIAMQGVSLAFAPIWHFNIGHALFDGLYPHFVSLAQHGLDQRPFRAVIGSPWHAKIEKTLPGSFSHNEAAIGQLAGRGFINISTMRGRRLRFESLVYGGGANGAKVDSNLNQTLGGARTIMATTRFRDHAYKMLNISASGLRGVKWRVIVIQNKRYRALERTVQQLQRDPRLADFDVRFVNWSPLAKTASHHTGVFADHIKLIAQTDIHVSGPGTGMLYKTFLQNGAIDVNLGELGTFPNYMDEYIVEGSPYLKALYYRPQGGAKHLDPDKIAELLLQGGQLLADDPAGVRRMPIGANLSPAALMWKAYGYWSQRGHGTSEAALIRATPTRCFKSELSIANHYPHEYIYGQNHSNKPAFNLCLLSTLRSLFDWRFPTQNWFGTHGKWPPSETHCTESRAIDKLLLKPKVVWSCS